MLHAFPHPSSPGKVLLSEKKKKGKKNSRDFFLAIFFSHFQIQPPPGQAKQEIKTLRP